MKSSVIVKYEPQAPVSSRLKSFLERFRRFKTCVPLSELRSLKRPSAVKLLLDRSRF